MTLLKQMKRIKLYNKFIGTKNYESKIVLNEVIAPFFGPIIGKREKALLFR
jgi:hypothetical protein